MYREAERAQELNEQLFARTRASGAIRPDLTVNDLSFVFEQLASVRTDDEERTASSPAEEMPALAGYSGSAATG